MIIGNNNEILLYTRLTPYQSEVDNCRLELIKRNLNTGEENILFQDDFMYSEGPGHLYRAYKMTFLTYQANLYATFWYPLSSEAPALRYLKLDEEGRVVHDSKDEEYWYPHGDGEPQKAYKEFKNHAIGWEDNELYYIQGNDQILISENVTDAAISDTGVVFYTEWNAEQLERSLFVFNGMQSREIKLPEKYQQFQLIQSGCRIYALASTEIVSAEQPLDEPVSIQLYELTGTIQEPLANRHLLEIQRDSGADWLMTNTIVTSCAQMMVIEALYRDSLLVLNTKTGEGVCLTKSQAIIG